MRHFPGICAGILYSDFQFLCTKDYTDETLCHWDFDLIMEPLFAKILIFVYLMGMYDNTTKKLSENTTLKMYMSYVVTCGIYQPG